MADVIRFDSTEFVNYQNGVLIRCMAGYHGNAHFTKITVLKRYDMCRSGARTEKNKYCHKMFLSR